VADRRIADNISKQGATQFILARGKGVACVRNVARRVTGFLFLVFALSASGATLIEPGTYDALFASVDANPGLLPPFTDVTDTLDQTLSITPILNAGAPQELDLVVEDVCPAFDLDQEGWVSITADLDSEGVANLFGYVGGNLAPNCPILDGPNTYYSIPIVSGVTYTLHISMSAEAMNAGSDGSLYIMPGGVGDGHSDGTIVVNAATPEPRTSGLLLVAGAIAGLMWRLRHLHRQAGARASEGLRPGRSAVPWVARGS
jgi:hypothetical protein